jgi:NitT/TauT family transport system ATP-binding protein
MVAAPPRPMVQLDRVTMRFDTAGGVLVALEDVSFSAPAGQFVALIGPSGCGKSTILRLLSDIHHPSEGRVLVDGRTPDQARKAGQVNLMFQESVLLPWLTVRGNVKLPLDLTKPSSPPDPLELIELVGLAGREDDYPHQLSGGMQQRVALARALITDPDLLLMDEPFAALDELTRDTMGQWLLSVWERTRKTVLFVTHSIAEAVYLSDRVIVLRAHPGRLQADVPIDLPRPRDEAIKESRQFFELLNTLRGFLRERAVESTYV